MANNYEQIQALVAAGNKMGLSNTITRDNGMPLDLSSVQKSYNDAVVYAATRAIAYHGQPLAVITDTDATLYIITPVSQGKVTIEEKEYDIFLKEVGSKTLGDETTITLSDDGVLSLAGFATAADATLPQKQSDGSISWVSIDQIVEGDGNTKAVVTSSDAQIIVTPTHDTASDTYTYDLSLAIDFSNYYTKTEVDDTVEDLEEKIAKALQDAKDYADANDANTVYDDTDLQERVAAIEGDYLTKEDKYDDTEVRELIADLTDTLGTAEGGLVKDIADNASAIAGEVTRATLAEEALGQRIDAIDYVDPTELTSTLEDYATIEYVDGQIDALETAIGQLNHFTTKIVSSVDEVVAPGILYLIKDESVTGSDKYNEYLFVDDAAVLIGDTTTDLSGYYTKDEVDSLVEDLDGALDAEITAREDLQEAFETFAAEDYVTQDELTTYDTAIQLDIEEAKQAAIDDADSKLAGKLDSTTFETFKTTNAEAIAAARSGAVSDVAAVGYALADEVAATYATQDSVTELGNTIDATLRDYAKTADVEASLATKIDAATIAHTSETAAEGATVSGTTLNIVVDAYTKQEVRDYVADVIEDMTGGESAADVLLALNNHITTYNEKVGQIDAKDAAQDTAIEAAQGDATKALADALANANAVSALTTGAVATNTSDITAIKGRLTTLETAKGDHESRIALAEGNITSLGAEQTALTKTVTEIQGAITALGTEDTRLAGLIDAAVAKFDDYDTSDEVDAKIEAVSDELAKIDLTPFAKTADVTEALAGKADASSVYTKTEADAAFMTETEVDARINALIVAADPEGGKTIQDIQNLVKYVDENAGEIAGLITTVGEHTEALGTISEAIAGIVQPKASTEISVATDGTLGIVEMNVNKLVQTDGDVLVLYGGYAN